MDKINEFKGAYRFLSNFYGAMVEFEGQYYPSSEHAYMAAKTLDLNQRHMIANLPSPAEAKKYGRKLKLRPDWEQVKVGIMKTILTDKFTRHTSLRGGLLATGDAELIEGNWWGDKIWGVCLKTGVGQNLLGRTLMEIRAELRRPSKQLVITVVNKHHGESGEYIGRGSPLGNPYPIEGRNTRDVVIEKYDHWLSQQIRIKNPVVIGELERLGNLALQGPLKLQCFCAPQACHGHKIADVLFDAISKTYSETHWRK